MCYSRCGWPRFFDFSPIATPEYKINLEAALAQYDAANDAITYTPYANTFVIAALGAVLTQTSKLDIDIAKLSLIFGILLIVIPAASVLITSVCKKVSVNAAATTESLIEFGVTNGYFNHNQVPSFPAKKAPTDSTSLIEEGNQHDEANTLLTHAACHRLLGAFS